MRQLTLKPLQSLLGLAGTNYLFYGINLSFQFYFLRSLEPSLFGFYAVLFSIKEISSIFLLQGLSTSNQLWRNPLRAIPSSFHIILVSSLFYLFSCFLATFFLLPPRGLLGLFLIFIFYFSKILETFSNILLSSMDRAYFLTLPNIISNTPTSVVNICLLGFSLFFPLPHSFLPFIFISRDILSSFLVFLASLFWISRFFNLRLLFKLRYSALLINFNSGIKFSLSRISELIFFSLPNLMITRLVSPGLVGSLSNSRYLVSLPGSLLGPLTEKFTLPYFINKSSQKDPSAEIVLLRLIFFITALLTPVCLIVCFYHFPIINFLLGKTWADHSFIVALLSPLILLLPLIATIKTFLYSVSANKIVSLSYSFGSGILLLLLSPQLRNNISLNIPILLVGCHLLVVTAFLSMYNFSSLFKISLFCILFIVFLLFCLVFNFFASSFLLSLIFASILLFLTFTRNSSTQWPTL